MRITLRALTSILDALGVFLLVAGVGVVLGAGAAMIAGGLLLLALSFAMTRGGKP